MDPKESPWLFLYFLSRRRRLMGSNQTEFRNLHLLQVLRRPWQLLVSNASKRVLDHSIHSMDLHDQDVFLPFLSLHTGQIAYACAPLRRSIGLFETIESKLSEPVREHMQSIDTETGGEMPASTSGGLAGARAPEMTQLLQQQA